MMNNSFINTQMFFICFLFNLLNILNKSKNLTCLCTSLCTFRVRINGEDYFPEWRRSDLYKKVNNLCNSYLSAIIIRLSTFQFMDTLGLSENITIFCNNMFEMQNLCWNELRSVKSAAGTRCISKRLKYSVHSDTIFYHIKLICGVFFISKDFVNKSTSF